MINRRISTDWSTTKQIAPFSSIVTHRMCISKHMINPRISVDWITTKPIAAFSCTPGAQEVHTKVEVLHLAPGLHGLGVLFSFHA